MPAPRVDRSSLSFLNASSAFPQLQPEFRSLDPEGTAEGRWALFSLPSSRGEVARPQPEVVMPEIPSRGLRLPFRVVQG